MDRAKILEFAKKQGYDGVEPLGQWRGYDIFEPTFDQASEEEPAIVGPPLMIMVQGETIRMSTEEESFEQIDDLTADFNE